MNELKPLYIIGAGGFGRETAWLVERINGVRPTWDLKGFIDDDNALWNTEKGKYNILGDCSILEQMEKELWCVCAIGSSNLRRKRIEQLEQYSHIHFATLIDPNVQMSSSVSIGKGSIICAGTIITVEVKIGNHCIINLGCTIGHDAVLEDFVTLYPSVNVSGHVIVGNTTEIGTGTQIIQGVKIGSEVITGAGSAVIRNLESNITAVGIPAKNVKNRGLGGVLANRSWTLSHCQKQRRRVA